MGVGRTNAWGNETRAADDPWPALPPAAPPTAAPVDRRPAAPGPPPSRRRNDRNRATLAIGVVAAFAIGLVTMAVITDPDLQVVDGATIVESSYTGPDPAPEAQAEVEEIERVFPPPETAIDTDWWEIDPRIGDPLSATTTSTISGEGILGPSVATIGDVTFIAARLNGQDGWDEPHVWRSRDGLDWEALGAVEPGASISTDVVSDGTRLIFGGSTAEGSAAVWTSEDGQTWRREIVQTADPEPGFRVWAGGVTATGDGRLLVGVGRDLDLSWFRDQVPDDLRHLSVWFDDHYENLEVLGPFGLVVTRTPVADLGISAEVLRAWDEADQRMEAPDRFLQTTPGGVWKPLDSDGAPTFGVAWDPVRQVFFSAGGESLVSSDGETWVRSAELHVRQPEMWRGLSVAGTSEGELAVAGLDPGEGIKIDLDPIMGAVDRWFLHDVAAGQAGMAISLGHFAGSDAAEPVQVEVAGGSLVFDGAERKLRVTVGSRTVVFDSSELDDPSWGVQVDPETLTARLPDPATGELFLEVDLAVLAELQDGHGAQVFDDQWKAFATSDGDLWHEAELDTDYDIGPVTHVDDRRLTVVAPVPAADGGSSDELAVMTFELPDAGLVPVTEPTGEELADLWNRSFENHPEFWDQRWTDFDVTASRASWIATQWPDLPAALDVVDLVDLDGVPHMITETTGAGMNASDRVLWRWTGSEWSELGVAVPAGYWWASWPATSGSTIVVGVTAPNGDAIIRRSTDGVTWTEQTVARAPELGLRQTVWAVATDGERTLAWVSTTSSTGTWTPSGVAAFGDDLRWRWDEATGRVRVVGPYQVTLASFSAEEAGLSPAVIARLNGNGGEDRFHLQSDPAGEFQQVPVEGPANVSHLEFDPLLERFVIQDRGGDGWESADGRSWALRDYYAGRRDGHWQDLSVRHTGDLLTLSSPDGELTFRTNLSDMFGQVSGWGAEAVVAGDDHLALIGQTFVAPAEQAERPGPVVRVDEVTLSQRGDDRIRVEIGSVSYTVPIDGTVGGDAELVFDLATRTAIVRVDATGTEVAEVPIEALAELERLAGWRPPSLTAQTVFVSDDALEWQKVEWTQGADPSTTALVVGDLLVIVETSLREPGSASNDRVLRTWTLTLD